MDLAELDTLTQPHPDRPAARYVAAGRRARKRRRLAAVGVVAALAVGGGATLAALPDGHRVEPATAAPSHDEQQTLTDLAQTGAAAGYTNSGEVLLAPGWKVAERIESPWPAVPPLAGDAGPVAHSVAFVLTKDTQVQWVLLDWEANGDRGAIYDDHPDTYGFTSLAAYVDAQLALRLRRSTDALVTFDTNGVLEAHNGITIHEQANADLPGDEHAVVARLQVLDQQWWLVARHGTDGASYVPLAYPFEDEPETITDFARHVRRLVAQGGLG